MPNRAITPQHLVFDPIVQPDGTTKYYLLSLPAEMHWKAGENRHAAVTVDGSRLRITAENGHAAYALASDAARAIGMADLWYMIEGEIDTPHAPSTPSLRTIQAMMTGQPEPDLSEFLTIEPGYITPSQRERGRMMDMLYGGGGGGGPLHLQASVSLATSGGAGGSGYAIQQMIYQAQQNALAASPFLQNAVAAATNPRAMPRQRTYEEQQETSTLRNRLVHAAGPREKARLRAQIEDQQLANSRRVQELIETRVRQGVERVVEMSIASARSPQEQEDAALLGPLVPFLSALASGLRGLVGWKFESGGREAAAGIDHPSSLEGVDADDRGREEWPLSKFFETAAATASRLHAQACRVRDLRIAKVANHPPNPYASTDLRNLGPYPDFPHIPDPGKPEELPY